MRAHWVSPKRLTKLELAIGRLLYPEQAKDRPRTRGECRGGPRPCPWLACKYNLYLDVQPSGTLVMNFPHLEPWEIPASCALDLAEQGGLTLEEIGELLGLSRERVRQIETMACQKLYRLADVLRLSEALRDDYVAVVACAPIGEDSSP